MQTPGPRRDDAGQQRPMARGHLAYCRAPTSTIQEDVLRDGTFQTRAVHGAAPARVATERLRCGPRGGGISFSFNTRTTVMPSCPSFPPLPLPRPCPRPASCHVGTGWDPGCVTSPSSPLRHVQESDVSPAVGQLLATSRRASRRETSTPQAAHG